jgi:hypothetical protein
VDGFFEPPQDGTGPGGTCRLTQDGSSICHPNYEENE